MEDKTGMPVVKGESEWRSALTPEQFRVCRQCGTEPPFSGQYWATKAAGLYRCVCCKAPLFRSETKFDSGTGWPSYWQPVAPAAIRELPDNAHGMTRVEIRCVQCDAHLGHVFDDGPAPTGRRYCVNSASLELEPDVP